MKHKKREMTKRESEIYQRGVALGVLLSAMGFVAGFILVIF